MPEAKRNPGLPKEDIEAWLKKLNCTKISANHLRESMFFMILIGAPELSAKLLYIEGMHEGFVVRAVVADIIHNDDVVEYEHHFKWGELPTELDSDNLFAVPSNVGAEFMNMTAHYSEPEDRAFG